MEKIGNVFSFLDKEYSPIRELTGHSAKRLENQISVEKRLPEKREGKE